MRAYVGTPYFGVKGRFCARRMIDGRVTSLGFGQITEVLLKIRAKRVQHGRTPDNCGFPGMRPARGSSYAFPPDFGL